MNKKTLPEQFKRNTAVTLIVCLFVLLWLPTLDYFFGLDHSQQPTENRALAHFPTLTASLDSVHDFPAGLENYFRDHFGFRNRLIRWERRWKHDWFRESAAPDVIIGRDGWLFFAGQHMIEHFEGLKLWTDAEINDWQKLLEKRRDWLAQRGIKYIFVLCPDKHSVYPELLPPWLAGLGRSNKVNQLIAHMKAHSTVEMLDLRPVLLEAKKNAITYQYSDTHWNSYGGFVAYQSLVSALQRQLPGLPAPLPLTAFDQRPSQKPGGDLTKILAQPNPPMETNDTVFALRSAGPKLTVADVTERFPKKWRRLTEPKATLFDGATGKAVMFRDSFAGTWYAFLGYNFHEVLYVWQYEWDAAFLEREKPQVVIDETLERFFNIAEPAKLLQQDALP